MSASSLTSCVFFFISAASCGLCGAAALLFAEAWGVCSDTSLEDEESEEEVERGKEEELLLAGVEEEEDKEAPFCLELFD